jgi:hypothetical protein
MIAYNVDHILQEKNRTLTPSPGLAVISSDENFDKEACELKRKYIILILICIAATLLTLFCAFTTMTYKHNFHSVFIAFLQHAISIMPNSIIAAATIVSIMLPFLLIYLTYKYIRRVSMINYMCSQNDMLPEIYKESIKTRIIEDDRGQTLEGRNNMYIRDAREDVCCNDGCCGCI